MINFYAKGGKTMDNEIKTVAFDLGGVLAYQDLSALSEEELFLFKTYMNRNNIKDRELIEYASKKIPDIYLKIHRLTGDALPTLEMLKDMKVRPSVWTNNIKEIDAWFEEVGLYRYIKREDIINSFYIGADKPELEFYQRALKLLKSLPQKVLFLDDKDENILSAERCGINGKLYNMDENLTETVESEIKRRGL